ncbi:hypothetical protein [Stenotrophomonas phage A1432]|uniref:Uncharacterized protein n=1 Tax=Stenotrophomonas phage A1432 TaxID=2930315 RepID=A0A9E7N193_9CAUD|nr:hypothetical protein P9A45_gp11 [Stenotrophomonas phage A1432]UTC28019.1 hypothetical protein [Stenotrophomonas phage A1432]
MDINDYMRESLEQQRRQTALLDGILGILKDINDNGVFIANADDAPVAVSIFGAEPVLTKITDSIIVPQGEISDPDATLAMDTAKEQVAETQTVQETAPPAEKPADKKKGPSIDEARTALKAFAAIEGNEAAMKILESLGATSVTGVAEVGKLQELIDKCEGK